MIASYIVRRMKRHAWWLPGRDRTEELLCPAAIGTHECGELEGHGYQHRCSRCGFRWAS